jgi:hypothetical protein
VSNLAVGRIKIHNNRCHCDPQSREESRIIPNATTNNTRDVSFAQLPQNESRRGTRQDDEQKLANGGADSGLATLVLGSAY